jgi:hypothetical protein
MEIARTAPFRTLARCLRGALLALALAGASRGAAADEPGAGREAAFPAARFRANALVVRLSESAARAAATRRANGAASAAEARLPALGLASLDALATSLGGATFEPQFPAGPRAAAGTAATSAAAAGLDAFYIVHLPPGADRAAALAAILASPEVATADAIALVPVETAPNDSLWSSAWHLYQPSRRDLHAIEAWEV